MKNFREIRYFLLPLLFAFALAIQSAALADTFQRSTHDRHWVGLSAFGIQSPNFQGKICNAFIQTVLHSPNPAIAVLYNTFGDDNRCLAKFWERSKAQNKIFLTQFHFSNEAGRRANNLDALDFQPTLDVIQYNALLEKMPRTLEFAIRDRVEEILALIEGYETDGKFILSAGLEDNFSELAWENLYRVLRASWPYSISRNPVQNRLMKNIPWEIPSDLILEFHGYTKRYKTENLCITNGDGQDVDFLLSTGLDFRDSKSATYEQVTKWMTTAKDRNCITFLWTGKWQGWYNNVAASRPLQRKFEFHREDTAIIAPLLNHELEPVIPKRRKRRS